MQIGFTSTSFRQIRSKEKIVSIAKAAGVDCIEWGGDIHIKSVEDAAEARELCEKAGIAVSSLGSYYRVGSSDEAQWRKICLTARELGCDSVRVWLGRRNSEKTDGAEYERLVNDAVKICAAASEFGLKVCPECHDNTFNNNTDAFLKIRNDVGAENFRTYFQSRYKRLEYDLDRIERTAPFIESVHISYSEQLREQLFSYDPSYIDTLLKKLLDCGFDGRLLVEYTYLFSCAGIGRCMINDIEKIRKKAGGAL